MAKKKRAKKPQTLEEHEESLRKAGIPEWLIARARATGETYQKWATESFEAKKAAYLAGADGDSQEEATDPDSTPEDNPPA